MARELENGGPRNSEASAPRSLEAEGANMVHTGFRWRKDDGSEITANYLAGLGVDATISHRD